MGSERDKLTYADLITDVFAPALRIVTLLKPVVGMTDADEAVHHWWGEPRSCWLQIGRALRRLHKSDLGQMPDDLRASLDYIRRLRQDAEKHCIGFGNLALFLAERSEAFADAADRGWIAAKNQGRIPSLETKPDKAPADASETSGRTTANRAHVASKRKRRRPKTGSKSKPLTTKQAEAVQAYGELDGDIPKAARRCCISPKAMRNRLDGAWKKIGKRPMTNAIKAKMSRLPTDKRGQETVPSDE
jgi:hypothetical protein